MKIKVEFWDFRPTPLIGKNEFLKLYANGYKTNDFQKLFENVTVKDAGIIITPEMLLAAALDCGYGAHNEVDQISFLNIPALLRKRLRFYQKSRMRLLWSLLDWTSGPSLKRHGVVKYIESTEKGDAAFILGCIGMRLAVEEWLKSKNKAFKRLWHYSVYTNCSVALNYVNVCGTDGRSRPDFLMQDMNDDWYAVEAKGSLDSLDWNRVREGLIQASQIEKLSYWEPSTYQLNIRQINAYGCGATQFSKNGQLELVFIDPPANANNDFNFGEFEEVLDFVPVFADLLLFIQSYEQFQVLSTRKPKSSELESISLNDIIWIPMTIDIPGKKAEIGLIHELLVYGPVIRIINLILQILVPVIADHFFNPTNEKWQQFIIGLYERGFGGLYDQLMKSKLDGDQKYLGDTWTREFANWAFLEILENLMAVKFKSEDRRSLWHEAMNFISIVPFLPKSQNEFSDDLKSSRKTKSSWVKGDRSISDIVKRLNETAYSYLNQDKTTIRRVGAAADSNQYNTSKCLMVRLV